MGCDIHAAIECKDGDGWSPVLFPNRWFGGEDEPKQTARLDFGRNYDAFAILANVRNGMGFAGSDMGDGFVPIAESRGLPDDITPAGRDACSGDHSDSFVTFDELLAYDWTRVTIKRAWVKAKTFVEWDRMKAWRPAPSEYCGGVSGPRIQHVTEQEMRRLADAAGLKTAHGKDYSDALERFLAQYDQYYCNVSWQVTYATASGELWERWFPVMLKLSREHSAVRMVMNFDS